MRRSHLLAQLHALAVADVSLLLQVLRVRDAPGAPARAGRGRAAARRRRRGATCKELLVLTGEKPEVNAEVAAPPRRVRPRRTSPRTSSGPASARSSAGCCPHSNLGVLDRDELARLREVNASMGLMLESVSERLMETVHAGSPTKHPAARLATIEAAGELRIPFTSGILVGIGETRGGAHRLARGARRRARAPRPPAGGDPPELRPAPALLRRGRSRRSPTRRRAERWAERGTAPTSVTGAAAAAGLGDAGHARRHEAARRASAGG